MPPQAPDHAGPPEHGGPFRDDTPAGLSTATAPVRLRHLRTHDEFVACVDLQQEVWGANFSERVPAAILKVSQRIGGITAGAFDADDRLAGFVFGLTGVENGELVHWSDMLAVRADMRDHGIGRKLKEFQRDAVRRIGVTRIYWTFDPLVARNAHLNLNRLGVRVVEYVPDMYGSDTSSALHRGIGSDRFIVAWPVNGAEPAPRVDRGAAAGLVGASPILNPADGAGIPAMPALSSHPVGPIVRIAVPGAIDEVQAASLSTAGRWRATTRSALTWALGHGYRVRAFYRDDQAGYGYYVLSTTPLPIEES